MSSAVANEKSITIAIAVGEPSGDILAAGLIREMRKLHPHCQFFGIGGPLMQEQGCELLYSMDSITLMGVDEVLKNLWRILKLRSQLQQKILSRKPDVFVGVDAPDFNIGLALKLKKHGLATVHYVSPTVWAWRSYRIHKIKRAVDHMLTLFPFEKAYYDKVSLPATFVGHPSASAERTETKSQLMIQARQELGITAKTVIGLMPGSRRSEFNALLPVILQSACQLAKADPTLQFVMPLAKPSLRKAYEQQITASGVAILMLDGQSKLAMRSSNVMILASGTAALEAMLEQTVMVVIYKVSTLSYLMFRWFASVKHFSMPNHLLANPIVPELSQKQVTAESICAQVQRFIQQPQIVKSMEAQFAAVNNRLAIDANLGAAQAVLNIIDA